MWIAPRRENTSKVLRYRTRSQGISVLPATPRSSANGMNDTSLFPAKAGTHLLTPEGWKADLAWVAGYILK